MDTQLFDFESNRPLYEDIWLVGGHCDRTTFIFLDCQPGSLEAGCLGSSKPNRRSLLEAWLLRTRCEGTTLAKLSPFGKKNLSPLFPRVYSGLSARDTLD